MRVRRYRRCRSAIARREAGRASAVGRGVAGVPDTQDRRSQADAAVLYRLPVTSCVGQGYGGKIRAGERPSWVPAESVLVAPG